jgi:hypothetical protein
MEESSHSRAATISHTLCCRRLRWPVLSLRTAAVKGVTDSKLTIPGVKSDSNDPSSSRIEISLKNVRRLNSYSTDSTGYGQARIGQLRMWAFRKCALTQLESVNWTSSLLAESFPLSQGAFREVCKLSSFVHLLGFPRTPVLRCLSARVFVDCYQVKYCRRWAMIELSIVQMGHYHAWPVLFVHVWAYSISSCTGTWKWVVNEVYIRSI